jgi:dTDP-glucose 4,6-dehydratase
MGKNSSSIIEVPDRKGHDLRYSVDISKATSLLGYKPSVNFDEGLEETINWYQMNTEWWKNLKGVSQ